MAYFFEFEGPSKLAYYILITIFAVPSFFGNLVIEEHYQWEAGIIAKFLASVNLMFLLQR